MSDIERNWLADLKAGDTVVEQFGGMYARLRVATVERATATLVIVNGQKYRRADGRKQGATGYHPPRLCEATAEMVDRVERQKLTGAIRYAVEGISHYTPDQLATEQLRAIRAVVEPLLELKRKSS